MSFHLLGITREGDAARRDLLVVGKEHIGAYGAAKAAGYVQGTPEFKAFVVGYLQNIPTTVITDDNHIITGAEL